MSSNFTNPFHSVEVWKRISQKALDQLETSLRDRLKEKQDNEAHEELEQLRICREEFENFTLLSLWTVFEEFLNTWLTQRIHWAGTSEEQDKAIRKGLLKRINHWSISDKVDAIKPIIGPDRTKELHQLRVWRNWVAHSKEGARPVAIEIEIAESLLSSIVTHLNMLPERKSSALI